ncbi:cytosine/purines uracil thiamine allantoin permease [Sporosarcina luteola]|uniref:Cytosine/purines uracil thiamine allantoin permease n=1 Tax=Sporosarcina luteola TaxID=582850 RepID=A0A511Z350_9BACL|nr:cytosine permease [Sporosarcina luteola]GEN81875.1 cytosine/purines uracil thiamine allantoin permease [Sporosarcina luteola]
MTTEGKNDLDVFAQEDGEYMLSPVPESERRPTWKQVMVWVGFGYVVTGLFVGGVLAGFGGQPGVPPGMALWAIGIGMGVLLVLTTLLGIMAQKTGLNLALISRYSYGSIGSNLPLFIMALLTLGWFASITGMVGQIWSSLIGNPTGITVFNPAALGYTDIPAITLENFLACAVFGLIFTYTAYKGMKAIEAVAIPVAPVILIIAIIVGIGMLNEGGGMGNFLTEANKIGGLGMGSAITIVMGSWIAGVVMGVDLFRFNKSIKAVFAGAIACFVLTNPLLNIVGYIGAVSVGQFNYVEWMIDKGIIFALIGVVAWTTSLWTTNNAELYCNSLYVGPVISSYKKKVNRQKIVLVTGVVGTVIGSLAFYQIFFADFITILGAAFLPLAGPLIADYFIVKKGAYKIEELNSQAKYKMAGIISFLIGAVLGLVFEYGLVLPFGLPSGLVALIITIALYPIIYRFTADSKELTAEA